jgi:hypothetical protein
MAIPNTTPTPNELYNGEMKKMNDTELRVVLVVTRKTLGWELDPITKTRKKEDWISRGQIIEQTGRSGRAVSTAIESCIKNDWIEARSKDGDILKTPESRSGKKIFYRLGEIFLNKITSEESSQVGEEEEKPVKILHRTSENTSPQPVKKVHSTKETITKETITKELATSSVAGKDINLLIEKFKPVNPSYEQLFKNTTQRGALERLLKKTTPDNLGRLINLLSKTNQMKYSPTITTPCQLEAKLGQLLAFLQKEKKSEEENKILKI